MIRTDIITIIGRKYLTSNIECYVLNVNKNSKVLDPCCGSRAFLARAINETMDDYDTKEEKEEVKASHIDGIMGGNVG